jgi:isocitrate/isopropylmalate dehydrogenase
MMKIHQYPGPFMRIAVLPGDDIGPEITNATVTVLQRADQVFGLGLEFDFHTVGIEAHKTCGTTLPASALAAALAADGVLLGPGGMTAYPPAEDGGINIPGTIRKQFDLYANIRPARTRRGVPGALPALDCVIVRENTEGFYADRNMYRGSGEFMPTSDTAVSVRLITNRASKRIAERAFRIAATRGGHVTVVGKRHVLKMTDGLFVGAAEEVARAYPLVPLREIDIDAMAADLYAHPYKYDTILTSNMLGDILSNLANSLSGSLGFACALNAGDERAVANAGHGSAPDIAGRGIANPSGLILSSALLLEWLGERHRKPAFAAAAQAINSALDAAVATPEGHTFDLGGTAATSSFARRIAAGLETYAEMDESLARPS